MAAQEPPWPPVVPSRQLLNPAPRLSVAAPLVLACDVWQHGGTSMAKIPPHLFVWDSLLHDGPSARKLIPFPEADFDADPLYRAHVVWQDGADVLSGLVIAVLCEISSWERWLAVELDDSAEDDPDALEYLPAAEIRDMLRKGKASLSYPR